MKKALKRRKDAMLKLKGNFRLPPDVLVPIGCIFGASVDSIGGWPCRQSAGVYSFHGVEVALCEQHALDVGAVRLAVPAP